MGLTCRQVGRQLQGAGLSLSHPIRGLPGAQSLRSTAGCPGGSSRTQLDRVETSVRQARHPGGTHAQVLPLYLHKSESVS